MTNRSRTWVLKCPARILGAFVILLVAAFAIGEGVPNPFPQPAAVAASFAALAAMLVGLVMAWKWDGLGGLLAIAGFAAFTAINSFRVNPFFAPAFVAGVLHVAHWATRRVNPARVA